MADNTLGKLKKSLRKLKDGFIQDVPDELSACEICRIPKCSNKRWDTCGYRIEQMISLEENHRKKQKGKDELAGFKPEKA